MQNPHLACIPLVRIVIPLICGISIYHAVEYSFSLPVLLILAALSIVSSLVISTKSKDEYKLRGNFGVIATLVFILIGYILGQSRDHQNDSEHFSKIGSDAVILRLQVKQPVLEKANSFQALTRVTHTITHQSARETKGNLLVFLEKDSLAASLKYGDIFFISNKIQQVSPQTNPHVFDFQKFLSRQNIFHQTYLRSGSWFKSDQNEGSVLISFADRLRFQALDLLKRNNVGGEEFAVVAALFLGYSGYLSDDLQNEYAGAGAIHILSVSGLHVGIIYVSLVFVFGFMARIRYGRYIRLVIILGFVWFYAVLTGLSPPVLRASAMLSFVAIAEVLSRTTNIYNTLAASALILIIIDPMIITRIGFQLSYLAVLGIVAIHPIIYHQVYFQNRIARSVWSLISVSLAAQVSTGPLAMYYFNQFPNYFLLANLLAIPISGVIMNTGVLFFIISPLPALSNLIGEILSISVWLLNSSVQFVEGLPYSTTSDVHISQLESFLIYGIIISVIIFVLNANKKLFISAVMLTLVLAVSVSIRIKRTLWQDKIIVYNIPNSTAIDLISGKNCYFIACNKILDNPRQIRFNIHENRVKSGISNYHVVDVTNIFAKTGSILSERIAIIGPYIQHRNTKIVIARHPYFTNTGQPNDSVDILIITQKAIENYEHIIKTIPAKKIIIDSSLGYPDDTKILEHCRENGFWCWSVRHKGAFEYEVR